MNDTSVLKGSLIQRGGLFSPYGNSVFGHETVTKVSISEHQHTAHAHTQNQLQSLAYFSFWLILIDYQRGEGNSEIDQKK